MVHMRFGVTWELTESIRKNVYVVWGSSIVYGVPVPSFKTVPSRHYSIFSIILVFGMSVGGESVRVAKRGLLPM